MTLETAERADLHVHYHETRNPELLREARDNNVTVLGMLEHGSAQLDEMAELVTTGRDGYGINILPGVELLFKSPDGIHYEIIVLGWQRHTQAIFDLIDPRGNSNLSVTTQKIAHQAGFLADRLDLDMGSVPENKKVLKDVHSGLYADTAIRLCRAAIANPANERSLKAYEEARKEAIAEHYARRKEKAGDLADFMYFRHFSPRAQKENPGESAYQVWGVVYDPRKVAEIAHGAGAVAILAHPPYQHYEDEPTPIAIMDQLVDEAGLDGWEGWYGDKSYHDLIKKAVRERRLALGGSGKSLTYENRVVGLGGIDSRNMFISARVIDRIDNYRAKYLTTHSDN